MRREIGKTLFSQVLIFSTSISTPSLGTLQTGMPYLLTNITNDILSVVIIFWRNAGDKEVSLSDF